MYKDVQALVYAVHHTLYLVPARQHCQSTVQVFKQLLHYPARQYNCVEHFPILDSR